MKNFSFSLYNVISVFLLVMFVVIAVCPFNLLDIKQAQRIAKWKSDFEHYNYCFSLVDTNEGFIAKKTNFEEDIANEVFFEKVKTYFNLADNNPIINKKYKYKRKNGRFMPKHSQFYFNKFFKCKDGSLISFKKNNDYSENDNQPLFFMFVDINGEEKPNRVGEDIFFIDIFEHNIKALGYDKDYSKIKQNCSPIGSGLYCSEFYLLGGHF